MDWEHRGHRGYTEDTEERQTGLSGAAIGCAMEVHTRLGPGLLERVYEESLCHELALKGLSFRRQVESPIRYRDILLGTSLRIDLLIEDALIIEVKAVESIQALHEAQLLTYLRLSGKNLGLLINFNVRHLRDGIRRRKL